MPPFALGLVRSSASNACSHGRRGSSGGKGWCREFFVEQSYRSHSKQRIEVRQTREQSYRFDAKPSAADGILTTQLRSREKQSAPGDIRCPVTSRATMCPEINTYENYGPVPKANNKH